MIEHEGRVLVVDDTYTNRILLSHRLKKLSIKVECADGGRQAIDMFEPGKYNLVFLDIQMPEIGGFEVLSHIRLVDSSTPVVAWTCSINKDDPYFLEAGFDAELEKPLDTDDFFQIISRFFDNKHSKPALDRHRAEASVLSVELDLMSREVVNAALEFTESIPERIKEIAKYVTLQDADNAIFFSHKLRGVCKMQGYSFLASILRRLQTHLEKNDFENANKDLEVLRDGVQKLTDQEAFELYQLDHS